jgi:hypothetical protein
VAAEEDAMWCEIRVASHLDATWSACFDGLAIVHAADGDTILVGSLADQAALHGVLARIRDLGLTLRSVECHDPAPRDRGADAADATANAHPWGA